MREQRAESREQRADELTDTQCAALLGLGLLNVARTPEPVEERAKGFSLAALLGLTKARRVRVQWRDGRAVCTAEVRANSVDEAIARLRRMEGLNLNCVMRAWEVPV